MREIFNGQSTLWIDLLKAEEEDTYQLRPEALGEQIQAIKHRSAWVVIDEIQRAPRLLDVVHSVVEEPWNKDRSIKFALTGSSARKLKRGAANLLAGRAFTYSLFPLTYVELGSDFDLIQTLAWGSLPYVVNATNDEERKAYLRSYAATYLKEEIIQEQLIRNVVPFRKFLPVAAQCSGTILKYNNIARDLGVDWSTVRNYFDILEDTLLAFQLPAYSRSIRKQQLAASKFYMFDLGVKRALDKSLNLVPESGQVIGPLFERFIICEMHRLNSYLERDYSFSYLTTQGGAEIDVIVERPGQKTVFIEIKSGERVQDAQLKHLRALTAGHKDIEGVCLSREKRARKVGDIHVLPWREGFDLIGLGA